MMSIMICDDFSSVQFSVDLQSHLSHFSVSAAASLWGCRKGNRILLLCGLYGCHSSLYIDQHPVCHAKMHDNIFFHAIEGILSACQCT